MNNEIKPLENGDFQVLPLSDEFDWSNLPIEDRIKKILKVGCDYDASDDVVESIKGLLEEFISEYAGEIDHKIEFSVILKLARSCGIDLPDNGMDPEIVTHRMLGSVDYKA